VVVAAVVVRHHLTVDHDMTTDVVVRHHLAAEHRVTADDVVRQHLVHHVAADFPVGEYGFPH